MKDPVRAGVEAVDDDVQVDNEVQFAEHRLSLNHSGALFAPRASKIESNRLSADN